MVDESHKQYDKNDARDARASAARVNLSEALGESAQKQKRNLLAWSAIAFLVDFYNVDLKHVPWLDVEIPAGRTSAAIAIVALPLLYTFFGFLLYALADLRTWRL